MSVADANGPLLVYFVYRDGDHSELLADHRAAFEGHDRLEYDSPFLRTPFGNVELGYEDVPALTGMSHLDNYTYEADDEEWDLLYAPLVRYYLGEGSYHLDDDGSDVSEELLEQFVEMVATGYLATERRPVAAYVETPTHGAAIDAVGEPPFTAESLARDRYEHLGWITVFTPPMVETYGRETLLSAPAWKTTELDDGGVLVVAYEDPHDPEPDGKDAVAEHIGLPSFSDAG